MNGNGNSNSVLTIGGDNISENPFGILAGLKSSLPETASAITVTSKKKKVLAKIEPEPEPDFSALAVKVKPSEEFDAEAVAAEAKKRREAVFGSASDYYKIRERIQKLQTVDGIEFTAQYRELTDLLAEQARIDSVLTRQPESIRNQFIIDLFLCELESLQPQTEAQVLEMLNRTISMGRARKGTRQEVEVQKGEKKEAALSYVYFRTSSGEHINLLHIPSQMPGREGQVSNVDRKLFYELRSLVRRFLAFQRERSEAVLAEEATRIVEIKGRQGLPLTMLSLGKEGFYTLYIPDDPYRPNSWGEGVGVIQALDLNRDKKGSQPFLAIRVEDGAGCMKSWREEHKGKWVALHIYKRFLSKELVPASISEVVREFSLDLCKKLLVATAYAIAKEKKTVEVEIAAEA